MLGEVIEFFLDAPIELFVDATLGDGGHAEAILHGIPDSEIVGIDRDPQALETVANRLVEFGDRMKIVRGRFGELAEIASRSELPPVGGVLFDLGVRSEQIDDPKRGFSYIRDGKPDMRMDPDTGISAFELVNEASRGELARIIAKYGEQPGAGRIARAIEIERRKKPIESTIQLAEIVRKAIHEATAADLSRVFQALRIEVNNELEELENGLQAALQILAPRGLLVVISYHSLEDRIVKQFIAEEVKGCICPPDLPVCRCGHRPRLEKVTKKPLIPSENEAKANPRARSAKMRVARKIF